MRIFRKFLFQPYRDENYQADHTGRNRLIEEWAAISKPEHHMPYGGVTLPYDDPDCERLVSLYKRISREYKLHWAMDALDISYEEELYQAPLAAMMPGGCLELSAAEFKRAISVHEGQDGRSFAEQTETFRVRLKGWKADCGCLEYDELALALLLSSRFCDLLRKHNADVSFREVIDKRSGKASTDFFQAVINTKLPIDAIHTKLIHEQQPYGGNRLYPGIFINFYHDVRDSDLYFRRVCYDGQPVFLTEQHAGVGKWLNDSRRFIVISRELCQDIDKLKMTGMALTPAYVVDDRVPVNMWGGTLVFGQDEFIDGTYVEWFEAKTKVLESVLGSADRKFYSARVPLHLGGESSVFVFRGYPKGSDGIAYVTSDLIGNRKHRPNRLGQYELMMCTRAESEEMADLLSRLAKYTLDEVIQPGETMEIGPAMPEDSTIYSLLFVEPEIKSGSNAIEVRGVRSGLLLCVGITAKELEACHSVGSDAVVDRLRTAGVFPFTDVDREDVDLEGLV